jgi:SAM-dependent methyltransferase
MAEYIYDPGWEKERERLRGLEAGMDPGTFAILERVGVPEGSHCLEVGGGGGSVTEWLCDRVGPGGRVVATDIDTRFLEAIDRPNLVVKTHDIVNDPPIGETFDLVHSRALLAHLPERRQAVVNMASAVKPGGWIVIEDVELTIVGPVVRTPVFDRVLAAIHAMMDAAGIDRRCGLALPSMLRAAGVADIDNEGRARIIGADNPIGALSVETLGGRAVSNGLVEQADLDQALAQMSEPDFEMVSPTMFAAWGRVPG